MLINLKAVFYEVFGRSAIRQKMVAVFIDGDGIAPAEAGKVLNHVSSQGQICILRIYGNFAGKAVEGWAKLIRNHGLVARHMPSLVPGKNASDIALTIDAIEVLLTLKIDTFVLIANDADFTPLAYRLREGGKHVVGYGGGSTPESLRRACGAYHDIRHLGLPTSPKAPSAVFWSLQPRDAAGAVMSALADISLNNKPVLLSALTTQLAHRQPGFDPRIYNHRTLSDLIRAIPGVSLVDEGKNRFVIRDHEYD